MVKQKWEESKRHVGVGVRMDFSFCLEAVLADMASWETIVGISEQIPSGIIVVTVLEVAVKAVKATVAVQYNLFTFYVVNVWNEILEIATLVLFQTANMSLDQG